MNSNLRESDPQNGRNIRAKDLCHKLARIVETVGIINPGFFGVPSIEVPFEEDGWSWICLVKVIFLLGQWLNFNLFGMTNI